MKRDSPFICSKQNWEVKTLGELCNEVGGNIQTGPFGSQLHAEDYVPKGIPSIKPKNISIEGISTVEIARISKQDAARLSKYLVQNKDIVYSRRGDVEKCALVSEREDGWLCGTGCLRVRIAVISEGVEDIFALAGLDKPNISLLSHEFLEELRNLPSRNLAVELLEKLLKDEIRARTRNNVVQEKKFGDRLLETLRKYHNRAIETGPGH